MGSLDFVMATAPQSAVEKERPSYELLRSLGSGGIANSISSSCLNFSDVVKVRMQTQKMMKTHEGLYTTFSGSMRNILRQEGVSGLLLPGLGASVLRELSYSSIRLGIYPQTSSRRASWQTMALSTR